MNKSAENATRKKEKPKKTDDKEKKERIKDATEKGEKKEKKKSTADKAGKNEKKNVVDDKATSGNQDKNNTRERKGPGKSSKVGGNEYSVSGTGGGLTSCGNSKRRRKIRVGRRHNP